MASCPWSPDDLQVLEQHVTNEDWLEALAERFPDRSPMAIKVRMSKVRSELGVKGKRGAREDCQDRANAKAVIASQMLYEAITRAGLRP